MMTLNKVESTLSSKKNTVSFVGSSLETTILHHSHYNTTTSYIQRKVTVTKNKHIMEIIHACLLQWIMVVYNILEGLVVAYLW